MDPSHLFFQGMDPLVVIRSLGKNLVFHVHAKDTRLDPQEMALNGGLDTRSMKFAGSRAWDYRTVGFGHRITSYNVCYTKLLRCSLLAE